MDFPRIDSGTTVTDLDADRPGRPESQDEPVDLENFDPSRPGLTAHVRVLTRLGLAGLLAAFAIVAAKSALNYFDLTLLASSPASGISEFIPSSPARMSPPTGSVEWTFDSGAPIAVPPLVADGVVFLVTGRASGSSRVVALDQATAGEIWVYPPGSVVDDRPVAAGDYLYLAMRGGRVVALDRRSGLERWSFQADDLSHGRPVVRDGVLYFASRSLYALDAVTGKPKWRHRLEGGRAISPIVLSGETIAVLSSGSHLNLVDARSGKRRYSSRLWFGTAGRPAVIDSRVVVSGDRGRVQAFELDARDVPMWKALRFWWVRMWSWDMAPRPPHPLGYSWHHRGVGGLSARPIAAAGDKLFLALRESDHTGSVVAMGARSGKVIWELRTDTPVAEWAAQAGDDLIVGTAGGLVYGIDHRSGEVRWEIPLGSPVTAVSVDDQGSILVATAAGALHKLR